MKKNGLSLLEAYRKATDEKAYKEEIEDLKDKNGHLNVKYGKWTTHYRYDILIKELKRIMEQYKKDGKDIYKQFISEIKETNYPVDIKEKLLADIKNDLFSKPSETKKELNKGYKKDIKEIENTLESLGLPKNLFDYRPHYWDCKRYGFKNENEIKEKLSSLPLDMQKKIIKNYGDVLEFFDNPSKELCLYALENTSIWVYNIPKNLLFNDLDIQLAIIKKTPDFSKKIKLLPQARIEYIKKYPEEIITNITKFNYNQEEKLTIYDLSKEELEIYKQSLEKYFVNKVKNDPTAIKEIKNPSQLVRETAFTTFKEQYIR